jgi:hypothetical protein
VVGVLGMRLVVVRDWTVVGLGTEIGSGMVRVRWLGVRDRLGTERDRTRYSQVWY